MGNSVPAIFADGAAVYLLVEIWDDTKNLAYEDVKTLWIVADVYRLLSVAAVARRDVDHAPVRVARARRGVEEEIGHR